jgi:hypothetical protein
MARTRSEEDNVQSNIEMVDTVNRELRTARAMATLIGSLDLERFPENTESLGDAASAIETHIDAAHEALRKWAEVTPN